MIGGSQKEIGQRQVDLCAVVKGSEPGQRSEFTAGIDAVGGCLPTNPVRIHQVVDDAVKINSGS